MNNNKILIIGLFFSTSSWLLFFLYAFNYRIQEWLGIFILTILSIYLFLQIAGVIKTITSTRWLYFGYVISFMIDFTMVGVFYILENSGIRDFAFRMLVIQISMFWLYLFVTLILAVSFILAIYTSRKK